MMPEGQCPRRILRGAVTFIRQRAKGSSRNIRLSILCCKVLGALRIPIWGTGKFISANLFGLADDGRLSVDQFNLVAARRVILPF
jgi:hypothetical protein